MKEWAGFYFVRFTYQMENKNIGIVILLAYNSIVTTNPYRSLTNTRREGRLKYKISVNEIRRCAGYADAEF